MHINTIRLMNFRGMKDLKVEFEKGINIIIGNNGAGKTSLLNGICIALGGLFSPAYFNDIKVYRKIQEEDVRITSISVGDTTKSTDKIFPVKIEIDLMLFNGQEKYEIIKENLLSPSTMRNETLKSKMREMISNPAVKLPLLNFQSDQKNLSPVTKMEQIPQKTVERQQGYEKTFLGNFSINAIQNWCFQMEIRNFQEHRKIFEYETFKQTISQFISKIEDKEINGEVYFASDLWTLVYYDGKNRQPLYNLSSGYQTILNMIMELTYRAIILNPNIKDFNALEGIVIIDEIDMHLHPKWQWKILDALKAIFPQIQFIIATHSPIIISSAENAHLLLMTSPNEVEPLENAYGINVDNVLELRQQSVDMPPELKELRKKILKYLNNNDIDNAKNTLQEAEKKYSADSALVNRLKEFFNMNKWIAEA